MAYEAAGYITYGMTGSQDPGNPDTATYFNEADAGVPTFYPGPFSFTGEDNDNDFENGELVTPATFVPVPDIRYVGTLTVQVNGVDTEFVTVLNVDGGLRDLFVLVPVGVDPADVTFPVNFTPYYDLSNTSVFNYCFAEGTRIATTQGDVLVEDLTRAHKVLTADGRAEPVEFLGWQEIDTRLPLRASQSFVQIAQGALGDGLPRRDLTVTGDHAMMIDGVLVNAEALVNGKTIRHLGTDALPPKVRVYHVETESHEVLLAEGAPSESFIDYGGRARFGNYAQYLEIHGADRLIVEMEAPRVTAGRMLPATIRARLDAAAGITGDAGMALAG